MLFNNIENDFSISLKEFEKINYEIERFKANMETLSADNIIFFSQEDIRKITGWSKHTVETLFNNPSFPCTDIGKSKLVLKSAFIKFFSERRCKDNELYWK